MLAEELKQRDEDEGFDFMNSFLLYLSSKSN
jgi:hypothetical protein